MAGSRTSAEQRITDAEWTLNPTQSNMTIEGELPFVSFDLDGDRIATGLGGCNRFSSPVTIGGEGSLIFGEIMATKMACPNLALETRFFDMLKQTNRYELRGNTLVFYRNNLKLLQFERK